MLDLTMQDCDHLIGIWRICSQCETSIETDGGILACQCPVHYKCPVPRVRAQELHPCSLELKREIVSNYVKNILSADDVVHAYWQFIEDSHPHLLNEANISNLKDQDWNLLMLIWKICHRCETSIKEENIPLFFNNMPCGCLGHLSACQPAQMRKQPHIPASCTNRFKREVVTNFVRKMFNTEDVTEAFRRYMSDTFPSLIRKDLPVFFSSDLKIEDRLGQGTQGVVELASTENRKMAVKTFPNGTLEGNYKRELANATKVSHHPNFIRILGVLYKSAEQKQLGASWIGYVMEYMPGGSVHDVIHSPESTRIEYNLTQILNWARQAACALDYLHKTGIIHRDVKPQNMLLSEDRRVLKLCDLGVSNINQTLGTASTGTLIYMAPEVMSDQQKVPYDEKCDVYSLVMSIWEMYHRKIPYRDQNMNNIVDFVNKVKAGERPSFANNCNERLRQMIERGWSSKIPERPSMEEIHKFDVE